MAGGLPRAYHGPTIGPRPGPASAPTRTSADGTGHGAARSRPSLLTSGTSGSTCSGGPSRSTWGSPTRAPSRPPAVRRRLDWTPGARRRRAAHPARRSSGSARPPTGPADLRPPAGERPLPAHEDAGPALGPTPTGFLLSVNTHDQALALDPNAPDAAAFRALQAENQRLKVEIEQAWDDAGLPTFLRYLRDYLARRGGPPPSADRPRSRTGWEPRPDTMSRPGRVSRPGRRIGHGPAGEREGEGRAPPGPVSTSTAPPCSSTNALTRQRPRPIPRLLYW